MNAHESFEQTTIPHISFLQNYAMHLTMNTENAKDLAQDTYFKAYRFWDKYEEDTNIKAWLCKIMKNSFINNYRKDIREPKKITFDESILSYTIILDGSFDNISLKKKYSTEWFGDEISLSIDSLLNRFKTVLILSDVEEFTYVEIADALTCPVGTVRSRLHRARKALQKQLFNFVVDNRYILSK